MTPLNTLVLLVSFAGGVSYLPNELWSRTLSFVDMRLWESQHLHKLDRRTFNYYNSDFIAISRLETMIHNIHSINDSMDFNEIWSLSKRTQLSKSPLIQCTLIDLHQYIIDVVLGGRQRAFYENPKARQLMHALGFQCITIQEYDALRLDDDRIQKMNITQSGKQKLKLLLLASRGSEQHLTAIINNSDYEVSDHGDAYNLISTSHNTNGCPIWIKSNFPWMAAPEMVLFSTRTYLLYFDALYEYLWTHYHHEFGFPVYDSMFYISDLDEAELVKKLEFVKYMMDHYRLRIRGKFSIYKNATIHWLTRYTATMTENQSWVETSMLITAHGKQQSFFWTVAEADRLNKLFMGEDQVLANGFMTEYVIAISEVGVFNINSEPNEIQFVEGIIRELIEFNGGKDMKIDKRLKGILGSIRSTLLG